MEPQVTLDNIERILSSGENQKVEFKYGTIVPEIIGKCIAAFANTDGGIIIIGYSPKIGVFGSSHNDEKKVKRAMESLKNPPKCNVYSLNYKGKNLIIIDVEKNQEDLTYYSGALYLRQGENITIMDYTQIEHFFHTKNDSEQIKKLVSTISDMNSTIAVMSTKIEKDNKKSGEKNIIWGFIFCILSAVLGFILGKIF